MEVAEWRICAKKRFRLTAECDWQRYYGGLKFVPLGFKKLVILQSIHEVKLNLSSCSYLAKLTLVKHDNQFNFSL